jgi:hypothetical protein
VKVLLDEVDEYYERFSKIRRKLSRVRRGSGTFLDLLADLEVELFTLKQKTEHAHEALEERSHFRTSRARSRCPAVPLFALGVAGSAVRPSSSQEGGSWT